MPGQLEKMRLIAYSDPQFSEEVADGTFVVQINPESYSFKYKIERDEQQASGTSATPPRFNKILPEEMDFEFLFDSTGAIPSSLSESFSNRYLKGDGVVDAIEHFKEVVLNYDGDSHQPRHIKLSWGTLLFKGSLSEMEITFKLFKPDGTPIRAVARAKFKGFVEDDLRAARENAQSPDLTHLRIVRDGDTLPRLCHEIYGDSSLYLEVADANNLVDFRQLQTGQRLRFPKLER
ncbi:MAG: LysM peptidoglycan-binding domain-containing protein [gamma proteobacterium endosymbiont of Lamellibrachia anaximandri]|nr:LysM peptidoglycan-binding domain-containing protein [gamma proteobacterium endosymbiont of Lamellibrachia anaximandri]